MPQNHRGTVYRAMFGETFAQSAVACRRWVTGAKFAGTGCVFRVAYLLKVWKFWTNCAKFLQPVFCLGLNSYWNTSRMMTRWLLKGRSYENLAKAHKSTVAIIFRGSDDTKNCRPRLFVLSQISPSFVRYTLTLTRTKIYLSIGDGNRLPLDGPFKYLR